MSLLRIQSSTSCKWVEVTPEQLHDLCTADPRETFTVRAPCDHTETIADGGIRYCERCREMLEILTHRD